MFENLKNSIDAQLELDINLWIVITGIFALIILHFVRSY